MKKRKFKSRLILWILVSFLIFINVIASFHAYKFSHFSTSAPSKTKDGKDLSTSQKLITLLFGIDNPRPQNNSLPSQKFESITIQSNKTIKCWSIKNENAKGTVIIFHGYGGDKSGMLDKSDAFLKLGYNTFLVDFMGSGESEGNQTTLGAREAIEVKDCYEFLKSRNVKNLICFGTSMGAVAILKAINDYHIKPAAIILECPFGSMYQTTCARFKTMSLPSFPMASLLVFWGGIENGFWAFSHKPTDYAKSVNCPTLLLYGEEDDKVSRKETDDILSNLTGRKELYTFPYTGHEDYLIKNYKAWMKDVSSFLSKS
jgi:pimeloyl-ACP methyl ester carboxylesterase